MESIDERADRYIASIASNTYRNHLGNAWNSAMKLHKLLNTFETKDVLKCMKHEILKSNIEIQKGFIKEIRELKVKRKQKSLQKAANIFQNLRYCNNYYNMLGIKKDANNEKIKKAYTKIINKLRTSSIMGRAELFIGVKKAFDTLMNRDTRMVYDLSID